MHEMPLDQREAHFCTISGAKLHPHDICLADILLSDCAESLARINRFTGHHLGAWYSVAEHSVMVSRLVPAKFAKHGLLHDLAESLGWNDLASPTKRFLPDYVIGEERAKARAYIKFGLDKVEPAEVKYADGLALTHEQRYLQPQVAWLSKTIEARNHPLVNYEILCLPPDRAKQMFLDRFSELFTEVAQ